MNKEAFRISSDLNESMALSAIEDATVRPLRLYDIVVALERIDDLLTESGGELTTAIEGELESLSGSLDAKVDSVCRLRQNRLASADACRAEIERLSKREHAFRRGAESLRAFLLGAFVRMDKAKHKTAHFTVWVQDNPISIRWTRPVEELPEQFKRTTIAPDIAAMQEARKAGEELPEGAEVVRGEHLRIL